jgi:hypothetical protein
VTPPRPSSDWLYAEAYARLSEAGDPLEKLNSVVPWEVFRKPLAKALILVETRPNARWSLDFVHD